METVIGVIVMGAMEGDGVAGLRLRAVKTKVQAQDAQVGKAEVYSHMEEQAEAVTPAGRLFLNDGFCCNIFCVLGFKNKVDVPVLKQTLCETLINHKRFSSVVVTGKWGREQWRRVDVNVDNHVIVADLPETKTGSGSWVEDYVAELSLGPELDRSRPLWEVHVLNHNSGDAAASAVFRIHHSLGDGVSLMSLLVACTRRVENPGALPSVGGSSEGGRASETKKRGYVHLKGVKTYMQLWWTFWSLLVTLWVSFVDIGRFLAMSLWQRDDPTVIRAYAGVEKLPKKIAVTGISLQDMQTVKLAVHGTVNDVLLGMVAMGVRRYLTLRAQKELAQRKGTELQERDGSDAGVVDGLVHLSNNLRVRALALVNTRASPGLQDLAEMMKGSRSQARWGNHLGYLLIPVPMNDYPTALDYVRAAKRIGDRKKKSLEAPFTYASGSLIIKCFGPGAAARFTYRSATQTSLTLSNMMGPTEEVMLGGNPITRIIPTVTGYPHNLCIHLQSYAGKVTLVATVVELVIPDPDILLQCCVDALQKMVKAASV